MQNKLLFLWRWTNGPHLSRRRKVLRLKRENHKDIALGPLKTDTLNGPISCSQPFFRSRNPIIPLLFFIIPIVTGNGTVSKYNQPQGFLVGSLLSILLLAVYALAVPFDETAHGMQEGYKKFVDPSGRYALEYPATMRSESANADEVKFIHPEASLRLTIIVQPRAQKGIIDEQALLKSLKQNLAENSQEASIVEEGRLPGLPGKQGYFVCSFKDKRGVKVMQLVQYYISNDKVLQLIISDRPQGFINVEKVIRRIHRSLKVMKPDLK